jgi:hypothetical protein
LAQHIKPELHITHADTSHPEHSPSKQITAPAATSPHSPPLSECGFADAVTDVVDIVKYETSRRGRAKGKQNNESNTLLNS